MEPSSCTLTGRRCSLRRCIEFLPGHHYSQSVLCHLHLSAASSLTTTSELQSRWCHHPASSTTQSDIHPYCATMPRLRHCMRCRGGNNRGGVARLLPSSQSCSLSSSLEHSWGRYPETHSSRGRLVGIPCPSAQPSTLEPSPQPPPRLVPSITSQTPNSTQFHFCCSLDHPHVVATISVSFREELAEVPSHGPPILQKHPRIDLGSSVDEEKHHVSGKNNSCSDNKNNSGNNKDGKE